MEIGMLWFDNDQTARLEVKVIRAAEYYQHKYGSPPTLCFVHPSMLPQDAGSALAPGQKLMAGKVEVRPAKIIRPHHLWIGVAAGN